MKFIIILLILIPNITHAHETKNLYAPPHYEYTHFQKEFIIDSYVKRVYLTRDLIRCIATWEVLHSNHQAKCRHTAHFLNLTNAMIHEDGAFGQPLQPEIMGILP